jgi:hypothetical protein
MTERGERVADGHTTHPLNGVVETVTAWVEGWGEDE